jgi:hypothetical protein
MNKYTVIGWCVSPNGKETTFVVNSVPGASESQAAHAAIADMQRRGATNVQPHKSRRTDVGA